jgi:hypothetical protein
VALVLRPASPEVQWVALMPAAVRTGSKTRLRREKIARLKSFACRYRLGFNWEEAVLS